METAQIKNLTFSYPEATRFALENINLTIEHGEFVVICGKSGCGKSTLLRHLKTALTPHGDRQGTVYYKGMPLEDVDDRTQSGEIGYVLQSPDNQIVTDKVWHELAFGLESLGYDNKTIRLRVAEMASYFGIQAWFHKKVTDLSGGQKQLLNLASIMAMQPELLILDEPTSQLDPIAASDFLGTIKKINQDLGITVVMCEHRLEEVITAADKVVVMDKAKIIACDTPRAIGEKLKKQNHDMFLSMPSSMQIYAAVDKGTQWPLTVREGRHWIDKIFKDKPINKSALEMHHQEASLSKTKQKPILSVKEVWFKYDKALPDVVKGLSMSIYEGEMYCIVGGNGTGKTTSLRMMGGVSKPYRGNILLQGKPMKKYKDHELYQGLLGVLPQNPQSLFVRNTVELDLYEMLRDRDMSIEEKDDRVDEVIVLTHLEDVLQQHPYDLSGGEQQRLGLAKILLMKPKILLLDEPTKGLDKYFKIELGELLKSLQEKAGVSIVMVSHDVEFCATYGDRCGLFFDGNIVTEGKPRDFFAGNSFYTTAANRMCRHLFNNAVTTEDVITLCKQNLTMEVEHEPI